MEHATVYSAVTNNYNPGTADNYNPRLMEKEPTDSGIKPVGPVSEEGSNGPMEVKIGESHHVDVKLKQKFSIWSTLGVSYSATSAPIAIGTYLSVVVGVGGSPVFFFGFILCSVFAMMICLVLAEMSAVYPHSSGQFSQFSEKAHRTFLLTIMLQARFSGPPHWLPRSMPVDSAMLSAGLLALVGFAGPQPVASLPLN